MSKKPQRATIIELLTFLNKSSIEPSLAWVIPDLYNKKIEYELQWIYDRAGEDNFYIRKKDHDEYWKQMTAEDLYTMMTVEKLDLASLEFQLLRVICVQAVCSHYFIERAGDLIGKERIEEAIKLITNFTDTHIDKDQDAPDEQEQQISKKQSKQTSGKVPRLKLVRKKNKKDDDED